MNMKAGTSLYVGPGVRVEGRVTQDSKNETIVIAGVFAGDIITQGRVVIEVDGKIEAANEIRCFDFDVAGTIDGTNVLVEAGILRLNASARVSVGEISLPPGGLEQMRGSLLSTRLRMDESNQFALDERLADYNTSLASPDAHADAPSGQSAPTPIAPVIPAAATKQEHAAHTARSSYDAPAAAAAAAAAANAPGGTSETAQSAQTPARMPAFLAAAMGYAPSRANENEDSDSSFDDPDVESSPSSRI